VVSAVLFRFYALTFLTGAAAAVVAPAQQIQNIAAASAANFESGLPPPGSIAAIFCTGLPGITGVVQAAQSPLPFQLNGVSVTIGGAPSPIFAVADLGGFQQINVQVPNEATSAGIVIQAGNLVGSVTAAFSGSPGDFFQNPDGTGVFQHNADYSLVTPGNPARSGEALIAYLTGIAGALIPTDTPAPVDPLKQVMEYSNEAGSDTYYAEVGGVSVSPTFFGLTPGLIGVYQMNFVNPAGGASPQSVRLAHYTCSGNFHGTCGPNNGNPHTSYSSAVTLPVQ
jgi:uncharacterized protein (TIGR03437 family)